MKKVILFLSVIGAAFLMTSCLDKGGNNYTDNSFAYLSTDDRGQVYAKTFSRYSQSRIITSNNLMNLQPGSFKFLIYSWDEANGSTPLSVGGQTILADNVQLLREIIDISRKSVRTGVQRPEVEKPAGFIDVLAPLYAESKDFMNDHWVVEYAFWAKKGEKGQVEFFVRDELNEKGEIVIDMHLTLSGTPEGDTLVENGDAVALDMSELRAMNSGKQELNIRFNYYKMSTSTSTPVKEDTQNAYKWALVSGQ